MKNTHELPLMVDPNMSGRDGMVGPDEVDHGPRVAKK